MEELGGIEWPVQAVAWEYRQFFSMRGDGFSCMQALEEQLLVPRVDAAHVFEWFGVIKKIPHAQRAAQTLAHGVPVKRNGVGDLTAAIQLSNHSSIDQCIQRFGTTIVDDGRLGRAFIPARYGFEYPWGGSLGHKGVDYTRCN